MRLIAIALLLAMTGCELPERPQYIEPVGAPVGVLGTDGSVREIDFNGTRCIVYDGFRAGGISCDFNTPRR